MAKKRIPDVQVSSMEVNMENYPSLTQEDGETEKTEKAASLPIASERAQRQSAWLMASIAGLVATIALALAWANRGLEDSVLGLLSEADAKVTAQVDAVREESVATFAAAQAMMVEEQQRRRQLAGALAVARLEAAVSSGAPYRQELELAVDLLSEDEVALRQLTYLAPSADQGLPPLKTLQANFAGAVSLPEHRALLAAALSSLRASVSELFSFASATNGRNEAYSGRLWDDIRLAQKALAAGDLQTAAYVVQAYEDVLPNARSWMQVAQERLEVEKALQGLIQRSEDYLLAAR